MQNETANTSASATAWYCLRTQPKKEHLVVLAIRKEMALEVFAPRISFYKSTRTGTKRFVEAVFPGYVFVHCSIDKCLRLLLSIRGVSGILRYGTHIPSLPERTVEDLRRRFPSDEAFPLNQNEFQKGDSVKLLMGSIDGFEAVFERYLPAGQRIQVLVELLGRQLPVTVPRSSALKETFNLLPEFSRR